MKTTTLGYPTIGKERELKLACEKYFKGELPADSLELTAENIRRDNISAMLGAGIDIIPCGDFTLYDNTLDTACMLGIIPHRYKALHLSPTDTYFAMARGYQGSHGDVKALAMKKWFNTNYHYMVPEADDTTEISLNADRLLSQLTIAQDMHTQAKVVVVGAFTLLKLTKFTGTRTAADFVQDIACAYAQLTEVLAKAGAQWIQFDEPYLVRDLTGDDIELFKELYSRVFAKKCGAKLLLQTYFGDVRDCYTDIAALDFDGIGLDFIEGKQSLSLVEKYGFPADKPLNAGVIAGKTIWRASNADTLAILGKLKEKCGDIVISTSCSLRHVPYTVESETELADKYKKHLAFAQEKLTELAHLGECAECENPAELECFKRNAALFAQKRTRGNDEVQARVAAIQPEDFVRLPKRDERERIQRDEFNLPLFPTTTIGSFPQTAEVRQWRKQLKSGEISHEEYTANIKEKTAQCIALQEEIGLDVLVHGEYERGDMVEYFGENLDGYIFTKKAWVQSYGTRCVKPPIIWGDISRAKPITTEWSVYAQSLTDKPVKGMLTGPVTILNWSFPREDISLKESAVQIALAIRDEVLDLEKNGIKIIQIDEAALREKLPLRKSDRESEYLSWAIPAFRLVHSGVKASTQIHTHMCYSEFNDIIPAIDDMDADVITFEASRSDLRILDALRENDFCTQVGPGVYDIHSPRVPTEEEMTNALKLMCEKLNPHKLWVNPDCGLKTRGEAETKPSLINMVSAARNMRR